jgi:hypothetical protein
MVDVCCLVYSVEDFVITITLPWPDKRLSPNARCHWREKANAANMARAEGRIAAVEDE